MDKLISQQAAIDVVAKWIFEVFGIKESDGTATVFKRLRELPSAQPDPCEDAVSRQAAIYIASGYCHPANIAKELAKLPSVQPKIIRCKDCLMHGVCRFEQGLGLDGYCSQAKRRTDG